MVEILSTALKEIKNNDVAFKMLRFLEVYYDTYIQSEDNTPADDDIKTFPAELTLPLSERSSGIADALEELTSIGVNLDEGDCFNPLMMSVGYADEAMTEFLILHGANPNYWLDMEDDPSNFYYDDLDIAYCISRWKRTENYVKALLNTAKVLAKKGKLESYHGHSLTVDTKKWEISFSGLKPLFYVTDEEEEKIKCRSRCWCCKYINFFAGQDGEEIIHGCNKPGHSLDNIYNRPGSTCKWFQRSPGEF